MKSFSRRDIQAANETLLLDYKRLMELEIEVRVLRRLVEEGSK